MNCITRIVVVGCLIISTAFAEKLEVKFEGKRINLPYWAAQKNPAGAIILINGAKQAQWSILLAHLAKKLAVNGWSAVLVNCTQDSTVSWTKVVPEVVSTLRQQKNNRIIVLHYGDQLKQGIDLYNKSSKFNVEGLILLSAFDRSEPVDKKPELSMPLMDIAGQFDYPMMLKQMSARKKFFRADNYVALHIPGASHEYEYSQQLLLSFMQGWMLKRTELQPTPPPPILVSFIHSIGTMLPKQLALDGELDWTGVGAPEEQLMQEIAWD